MFDNSTTYQQTDWHIFYTVWSQGSTLELPISFCFDVIALPLALTKLFQQKWDPEAF